MLGWRYLMVPISDLHQCLYKIRIIVCDIHHLQRTICYNTFFGHATLVALLEPAVLTSVPRHFVDRTVLVLVTRILHIFLYAASEEPLKCTVKSRVTTSHVFVKHGCPQCQQSQKIFKSYITTPPLHQGHVMSVKCEEPLVDLQSKFGYYIITQTLIIALFL